MSRARHGPRGKPKTQQPPAATTSSISDAPARSASAPARVLVIDDDIYIAQLLHQVLVEEGYDAHTAVQSLRAYDAIIRLRPHIIILDLMMPYLEGEDILRIMRLNPDIAAIAVIVLTAKSIADLRLEEPELRQLGVTHIIHKPCDLQTLLEVVHICAYP